jgi:hypothetical protein
MARGKRTLDRVLNEKWQDQTWNREELPVYQKTEHRPGESESGGLS